MRLFYVGMAVLLVLLAGGWLITRVEWVGWLAVIALVGLLGLVVTRLVLWRGAPDDKFPWE